MYQQMRFSVFVSHSHDDLVLANKIERSMASSYLEPFLAHKSIQSGDDWHTTLLDKIMRCDVLVALLTPNFYKSEYTGQEVGAAWGLGKIIFPICNNETPRGFIKKFQCFQYADYRMNELTSSILESALRCFGNKKVDRLVDFLTASNSYDESGMWARLLSKETQLNKVHVAQIKNALITNDQVRDSRSASTYLDQILNQ